MRRLVPLLLLGLLALPASAAAAPGTLTISYSPDGHTMVLTGTDNYEGASVNTEGVSAALGGGTGFRILPNATTGENATAIVVDPSVPANTCEASVFAGGLRCKKTGVTLITADLKATGDNLDTYDLGATPPATTVSGGDGGDYLLGSYNGDDTINGGAGQDTLVGRGGNDTLNGDAEGDRLLGEGGNDTINGGDGNDTQSSGAGALLDGGDGNDTMSGGPGNDEVYGRNDNDTLSGDAGNDSVVGDAGNDGLNGGTEDDTLSGGDGTDTFVGGPGSDGVTYQSFSPPGFGYSPATPGVRVTLDGIANDGPDSDFATAGIQGSTENVGADIENVTGSNLADELTGGAGNETLSGASGHDTISGAGGNDTLLGGGGDEVFLAEPGADTYDGGGADTIDVLSYAARSTPLSITLDGVANDGAIDADPGTAGNQPENDNVPASMQKVIGGSAADAITGGVNGDQLLGSGGTDTVKGGGGNDLLDGGPGVVADTVDGEAGSDTVDYSARTLPLTVNLGDAATDGEAGEGDALSNLEGVIGGSAGDTLTIGTVATDASSVTTFRSLDGRGGADTITGSNGIDTLLGGLGDDTINALQGPDKLAGGDGSDTLNGGADGDLLFGDAGIWTNYSYSESGAAPVGEGPDTLLGGTGGDVLVGGSGNDTLQGEDDGDTLWGGLGADQLLGGAGSDAVDYSARAAGVTVTSSNGAGDDGNDVDGPPGARDTADSIEQITGSNSADAITGTGDANTLKGLNGDDQLLGVGGDDTLDGGNAGNANNGADVLDGGTGFDTVTYGGDSSLGDSGVTVTLDGVQNDGRTNEPASRDNVLATEQVIGSIAGDTITGTDADEIFDPRSGPDTVNAAGGNDTVIGGYGADTINGGDGNDLISTAYWDPRTPTWGVADSARDTVDAGPGDDAVIPMDRGAGANGNIYKGGPGNDTLSLTGEIEPSRLSQDGVANDGVINGGGGDNISEFELLEGSQVNDTLTGGGGALELRGLGGTDTINGSAASEVLRGGPADDTINAGEGDDTLEGGAGKDALNGEGGTDTASYAADEKVVKVTLDGVANDGQLDISPQFAGNQSEGDNVKTEAVTGGDAADQLIGDGLANVLRGGLGNDNLDGGAGDDTVDGGPGTDTLLSGTGADTLDAADGEADTLTCDVRDGKTIRVDATLDAFSTCAASAPLGEVISSGANFSVPPIATLTEILPPAASAGAGSSSPLPPRPAKELAKGLRAATSGAASAAGAALKVGSATCGTGRTCTVTAQLLAGKRTVASGTKTGTGKLAASVRLTTRGWNTVRTKRTAKFTLVLVLFEGGSQATVKRSYTVRLGGGR